MTSKGPYMMEKKHETNYAIYDAHRLLDTTQPCGGRATRQTHREHVEIRAIGERRARELRPSEHGDRLVVREGQQ